MTRAVRNPLRVCSISFSSALLENTLLRFSFSFMHKSPLDHIRHSVSSSWTLISLKLSDGPGPSLWNHCLATLASLVPSCWLFPGSCPSCIIAAALPWALLVFHSLLLFVTPVPWCPELTANDPCHHSTALTRPYFDSRAPGKCSLWLGSCPLCKGAHRCVVHS